jgi:hypothetical protein
MAMPPSRPVEPFVDRDHHRWWQEGLSAFEPSVDEAVAEQPPTTDTTARAGNGIDWADLGFEPPAQAELPAEAAESSTADASVLETPAFASAPPVFVRLPFESIRLAVFGSRRTAAAALVVVGALGAFGFLSGWSGNSALSSPPLLAATAQPEPPGLLVPLRRSVAAAAPNASTRTPSTESDGTGPPAPSAAVAVTASGAERDPVPSALDPVMPQEPSIPSEPVLVLGAPRVVYAERPSLAPVPETPGSVEDHVAVEKAIRAFEQAHDRLDADAMAALGPSLDAPGLSAALDGTSARDVTFRACDYAWGSSRVTSVCRGEVRYVRSDATEVRAVVWTFTLVLDDGRWRIDHVMMR